MKTSQGTSKRAVTTKNLQLNGTFQWLWLEWHVFEDGKVTVMQSCCFRRSSKVFTSLQENIKGA